MNTYPPAPKPPTREYVCPSCRLTLLSWHGPTGTVHVFRKVGLCEDLASQEVRLICHTCLGASSAVPASLADLLRRRLDVAALAPDARGLLYG